MSAQPSPWDTAADLATDEDLSAHLDVCFEEGGSDARFASRSPAKIA
jgi:DNA-binding phage protein